MGGFICVALIVIALLWNKFMVFIVDLNCDAADAEGERRRQERLKREKEQK